jgi:CheY-like chemotaxis protein
VDVLQKPISREELLTVLRRNLRVPRPRILVVDDEPDARQLLVSYLEEEHAEVRTATNGCEALDRLKEASADLILLDLMMPVMDGMAFLDAIRLDPRWLNIPVVVITAKELSADEIERLKRQTLEVVSKAEIFAGDLKQLLQRMLHRAQAADR